MGSREPDFYDTSLNLESSEHGCLNCGGGESITYRNGRRYSKNNFKKWKGKKIYNLRFWEWEFLNDDY